ncbi:MAG: glycosyltransferase [Candidatus Marsarchaeota archaeon]|nr:glycosyltransferase [Candidatus Marsarchaeota archaeon]
MRIAIDVRYLSHGLIGGVHTYVANLARVLADLPAEHEFLLYADTKRPFELPELEGRVKVCKVPWRSPLDSARHDLLLGRRMARDGADIAHFPANVGLAPPNLPTVITLHDALNLYPLRETTRNIRRHPKLVAMTVYLHLMSLASVKRATQIITVSEHAEGNIYVADTYNHRIQKLSPEGQPLAQWGSQGNGPGQFNLPGDR